MKKYTKGEVHQNKSTLREKYTKGEERAVRSRRSMRSTLCNYVCVFYVAKCLFAYGVGLGISKCLFAYGVAINAKGG